MSRLLGFLLMALVLVSACEPEATPLPGNLPTRVPPTPTPTEVSGLRYAVAPNALPYLSDADRQAVSADAELIALDAPPIPDDLGARYDLVVALGDLPDGTETPSPLQISLIVNTSLAPLDDPALADIVRSAVDPQQIARALNVPPERASAASGVAPEALRTRLANAGYPDGFDLTLAALAPGADALAALLASVNIHARIVIDAAEPAHLTLTTVPATDALPILTIPISYRAVEGLTITFTESGFPVAER